MTIAFRSHVIGKYSQWRVAGLIAGVAKLRVNDGKL